MWSILSKKKYSDFTQWPITAIVVDVVIKKQNVKFPVMSYFWVDT